MIPGQVTFWFQLVLPPFPPISAESRAAPTTDNQARAVVQGGVQGVGCWVLTESATFDDPQMRQVLGPICDNE